MSACEDCQLAWQGNSTRCPQCGKETVLDKVDDGGAAFPEARVAGEHGDYWTEHTPGMTLRDYFAGQALIATYMNGFGGPSDQNRAILCYQMADAMLAARKK